MAASAFASVVWLTAGAALRASGAGCGLAASTLGAGLAATFFTAAGRAGMAGAVLSCAVVASSGFTTRRERFLTTLTGATVCAGSSGSTSAAFGLAGALAAGLTGCADKVRVLGVFFIASISGQTRLTFYVVAWDARFLLLAFMAHSGVGVAGKVVRSEINRQVP